jgi:predicted dehydrogenase
VNVLLVGLGRWGEKHLRVLTALGMTVWVADVSAARLAFARAQGIDGERAVSDYRRVLDVVDAVDIVTPADTHVEIARESLAAGRHCFIEKPLAPSVHACRRLVEAADAAGRVVQVGHIFRFHPVTTTLRRALRERALGQLRYATGRFAGFKRPRADVGVTLTDAIHFFDLFGYLLGREATAVSAVQRDCLGRGLDDMSVATVHYGEIPVVVEANYFAPDTQRECVLFTERGALVGDYVASTVWLHAGQHRQRDGVWEAVDGGKEELSVGRDEPLRAELAAFLDACAGRATAPVDARAGLRAVEIAEAAAHAARLGRVVSLAEVRTG